MNQLELIQSKIYEIRGQKVMLDRDLAELYQVETRVLNQAVKRNIDRFPEDFMFRLTNMAIQVNINIMRVFTAVRQLIANPPTDKNSVLQKEVKELKQYIEEMFADQNDINEETRMQLELINQTLAELQVHKKLSNKPRRPIGFIRPQED